MNENPKPVKSNSPWLTSCTIDGEVFSTANIELFPDQSLTLEFIAPAFHGFRTFYQYRLNKSEWSARTLVLDNLKPGNYTVEIRSRKEGGYLGNVCINLHLWSVFMSVSQIIDHKD